MGIDYDGGMIVGSDLDQGIIDKLKEEYGDDLQGGLYDIGIRKLSPYFDADDDYCKWGFEVEDIPVEYIDQKWIRELQEKAKKFEEITGVKASLIGCHDIT